MPRRGPRRRVVPPRVRPRGRSPPRGPRRTRAPDEPVHGGRGRAGEPCEPPDGGPLRVPPTRGPLVARDGGARHDLQETGRLHRRGGDRDGVDGVLLVGHRRRAAGAREPDLADLLPGEEHGVAGDPPERGDDGRARGRDREHRRPFGVPGPTRVGEPQAAGEAGAELCGARGAARRGVRCRTGADGAAELHGEARGVDGVDRRGDAVEPPGREHAERRGLAVPGERAGDARALPGRVRECGEAAPRGDQGGAARAQRVARDEHERGVDDVLARRAEVQPICAEARRVELRTQRRHECHHRHPVTLDARRERPAVDGTRIERVRLRVQRLAEHVAPRSQHRPLDLHHRGEHGVVVGAGAVGRARIQQSPVGHRPILLRPRCRSRGTRSRRRPGVGGRTGTSARRRVRR